MCNSSVLFVLVPVYHMLLLMVGTLACCRLRSYGLDLFLLSIDEGIAGYRDDSLETVKRNEQTYGIPLKVGPWFSSRVAVCQCWHWPAARVVQHKAEAWTHGNFAAGAVLP
eukprot:GHRR01028130.1.p1 GENE.GHRR01028130.1~~GHRR01028130.1.p1  ORF type:complete len:111 (+),score=13.17 GHRR01028130.1:592-924(+)